MESQRPTSLWTRRFIVEDLIELTSKLPELKTLKPDPIVLLLKLSNIDPRFAWMWERLEALEAASVLFFTHYWKIERAQHSARVKPTTSRVLLHSLVIFRCAATAAQAASRVGFE